MSSSSSTSDILVPRTPTRNEQHQKHAPTPALNLPTPPASQHQSKVFRTDGLLPSTPTYPRPPVYNLANRLTGGIERGTGLGLRNLPRRLRMRQKDNLESAFTKPAIRRLARRGGIRRIKSDIYAAIQGIIKRRLTEILRTTCEITDSADRKTITTLDVIYALKRMGTPLYGFGVTEDREAESRAEYMRKRRAEARRDAERVRGVGGMVWGDDTVLPSVEY